MNDMGLSELTEKILTSITTLHGDKLVIAFLIMLGYALRAVAVFPNKFIPLVNFFFGPVLVLLTVQWPDPNDTWMLKVRWPEIAAWASVLMHGLLVTCIAWMIHAAVLRRIEQAIKKISGSNGDTKYFTPQPGSTTPVP